MSGRDERQGPYGQYDSDAVQERIRRKNEADRLKAVVDPRLQMLDRLLHTEAMSATLAPDAQVRRVWKSYPVRIERA